MYSINQKNFGYYLVFGGFIQRDEMKKWVDESEIALENAPDEFGVFVDMRTLKPLPQDSQAHMQEGQKLFKRSGMIRSVVIVNDSVTNMQFKRIAKETGIYEWERYIDASTVSNWEETGLNWIKKGIDPDWTIRIID